MNETLLQLVVQAGTLGTNVLLIFILGKKLDKLNDGIVTLLGRASRRREPEPEDMFGGTD